MRKTTNGPLLTSAQLFLVRHFEWIAPQESPHEITQALGEWTADGHAMHLPPQTTTFEANQLCFSPLLPKVCPQSQITDVVQISAVQVACVQAISCLNSQFVCRHSAHVC